MRINVSSLDIETQRAVRDILKTYHSEAFNNVKSTTLRVIDLLYKMGYYKDSESLFDKDNP